MSALEERHGELRRVERLYDANRRALRFEALLTAIHDVDCADDQVRVLIQAPMSEDEHGDWRYDPQGEFYCEAQIWRYDNPERPTQAFAGTMTFPLELMENPTPELLTAMLEDMHHELAKSMRDRAE